MSIVYMRYTKSTYLHYILTILDHPSVTQSGETSRSNIMLGLSEARLEWGPSFADRCCKWYNHIIQMFEYSSFQMMKKKMCILFYQIPFSFIWWFKKKYISTYLEKIHWELTNLTNVIANHFHTLYTMCNCQCAQWKKWHVYHLYNLCVKFQLMFVFNVTINRLTHGG